MQLPGNRLRLESSGSHCCQSRHTLKNVGKQIMYAVKSSAALLRPRSSLIRTVV